MSEGRIATTAVMLAIFAGMSLLALGFPEKARFAPLLIGVPGAILCLAQLVLDLRGRTLFAPRPGESEAEADDEDRGITPREWFMFAWLAVFTAAIALFGFHIGGTAVVFLYLRFASREPWLNAVLGAAGTFLTFWLVFDKLLELTLFTGLLLPRIF